MSRYICVLLSEPSLLAHIIFGLRDSRNCNIQGMHLHGAEFKYHYVDIFFCLDPLIGDTSVMIVKNLDLWLEVLW